MLCCVSRSTIISIHSVGPPSETAKTRTGKQGRKSDLSLLQRSWSVYLFYKCSLMLVFRRSLEIMEGCLCCPSVWQPLREREEMSGGWDTCLYTLSVCSIHHESREALGYVQGYLVSSRGARLPCRQDFATERVADLSHWSRGRFWGRKIGHGSANNSKNDANGNQYLPF